MGAAFQLTIDSGDPVGGPVAAMELAQLLEQHGDVEGARRAFQFGVGSGDEEFARYAMARLKALDRQLTPPPR
jgi:hypothetical protein